MRIAVAGGGPAGLVAGYELTRKGHEVTVFEAEDGCGGLAGAVTVGNKEVEKFYHHIFTGDKAVIALIEELGLAGSLVWKAPKSALYTGNGLYPFTSPGDLLRFKELSFWNRASLGLLVYRAGKIKDWRAFDHVPAKEWVGEQAGREVYEKVWGPLLASKFDRDADRVSAAWLGNKFRLRGATRDKITGPEKFGYLDGGFIRIYRTLADRIEKAGGRICCSRAVRKIAPEKDGTAAVVTAAGRERFERVIVTTAPEIMLNLVDEFPPAYVSRLKKIKYQANLCLVLELLTPLSPYYWITVTDRSCPFVAVIEHTNLVPVDGYGAHIVYLSRYIDEQDELYRAPDEKIKRVYTAYLPKIFPSWNDALLKRARLYRARYAQPVVVTGYGDIVPAYRTPVDHLFLASMAQIYPEDRGQNYSIKMGKEVAGLAGADAGK